MRCPPSQNISNSENKGRDIRRYIKTLHHTFDTPKARVESEHHVLWHILDRFLFFVFGCNFYSVCNIFLERKLSRKISQCPIHSLS